jgi:hypothetical protein
MQNEEEVQLSDVMAVAKSKLTGSDHTLLVPS